MISIINVTVYYLPNTLETYLRNLLLQFFPGGRKSLLQRYYLYAFNCIFIILEIVFLFFFLATILLH
jgi:hypothetical protein